MSTNDRLQKGDTILVTGATGLIGSWVPSLTPSSTVEALLIPRSRSTVDALVSRGFKVRGVTRDVGKTQLLKNKIDKLYGPGNVEFVQIGDSTRPDAYLAALQGEIVH